MSQGISQGLSFWGQFGITDVFGVASGFLGGLRIDQRWKSAAYLVASYGLALIPNVIDAAADSVPFSYSFMSAFPYFLRDLTFVSLSSFAGYCYLQYKESDIHLPSSDLVSRTLKSIKSKLSLQQGISSFADAFRRSSSYVVPALASIGIGVAAAVTASSLDDLTGVHRPASASVVDHLFDYLGCGYAFFSTMRNGVCSWKSLLGRAFIGSILAIAPDFNHFASHEGLGEGYGGSHLAVDGASDILGVAAATLLGYGASALSRLRKFLPEKVAS